MKRPTKQGWSTAGADMKISRQIASVVVFTLVISVTGCESQMMFDSKKWKEHGDLEQYPFRELMLRDIVEKNRFIGLSYESIVDSLGQPEKYANGMEGELCYPVVVDYGTDIDPVYTKYLVLAMSNDSTVDEVEIREWRNTDGN